MLAAWWPRTDPNLTFLARSSSRIPATFGGRRTAVSDLLRHGNQQTPGAEQPPTYWGWRPQSNTRSNNNFKSPLTLGWPELQLALSIHNVLVLAMRPTIIASPARHEGR